MELLVLLLLTSSVLAANVVDEVNRLRQGFAASNGIPDMWKLVESEEMIKIAKTFSTDCSIHKPGKNYRYFYFHGNDQAGKFEGSLIAFINQNEHTNIRLVNQFFGSYMRKTAFFMDFLEPTQKKIGCVPMNCKLTDVSKQFTPEYKILCVLGDSQPSMPLPLPKSDKKPGTECGSNGHGEDGLCVENT
ncbi:SCP domain-containing protein [Caenorhabditis elegans]|uniref:SCP domain-containing protein n=1 Tax=Caenorhabditis elegans TaxID=6239 RepID=O45955_CAEEL|nr:SCP domain-containing protein [Caenorhabditis elegans]CAA16391.2 SCP domain-containing protein [Caenorhabditis elegans]|eukprot:NP_507597.2 Uncharacterized protein CELE_Y51A2B.5 [Caenorhabditis elegans]